jgi:hypothetical protein
MNTVAGWPVREAASATPCAWFPADAATTGTPGGRREMVLYAPRILNEPVRWRFSALRWTSRPTIRENVSVR